MDPLRGPDESISTQAPLLRLPTFPCRTNREILRMHPEMKMLAAVVVLFVAVGVSDCVIVSKCNLKHQLEAVLALPPNATDILAKIVCHVELTSNFSTSAVNTIPEPKEQHDGHSSHGSRERRSAKSGGKDKGRPSSKATPPPPTKKPKDNDVWTMYGLFQLSDHVACNSTQGHTLNLCGLTCQKLIDDDITDDLACVKLLMTKMSAGADHETAEQIQKLVSLFNPQCAIAKDSSYFSDCPK